MLMYVECNPVTDGRKSYERDATYHELPFLNCKDQPFNAKHQRLFSKKAGLFQKGQLISGVQAGSGVGGRFSLCRSFKRVCSRAGANQTV